MPTLLTDEEQEEHHSKHPPLPGHKEHSCTDTPCLIFFVSCLALLAYIGHYSLKNGDYRRICHGYNSDKQVCGVDNDAPYLFWCLDNTTQDIVLDKPVCIETCPDAASEPRAAYCAGSSIAYPSQRVGNWCLPQGDERVAEVLEGVTMKYTSHVLTFWRDVRASGPLVLPAVVTTSIVIGYMYIFLMHRCAKQFVSLCQFMLIGGCIGFGMYVIDSALKGHVTAYAEIAVTLGIMLVAFGVILFFVLCLRRKNLDTAVGCIEAAAECIAEEPTLLIEPLAAICAVVCCLVSMLVFISWVASTGEVAAVGSRGVRRVFTYTYEQSAYLAFSFFMLFWMLEFSNSLSQYVLSWTAQMWYFTPYVDGHKVDKNYSGVIDGYLHALRYHVGTIALGSLLITYLRGVRIAGAMLVRHTQVEGNLVTACLRASCDCCIALFHEQLAHLTKNAYMDVAISSSTFCTGARRALDLLTHEVPAVAELHGCQNIFHICGVGMIVSVNVWVTLAATNSMLVFTEETSPYFVTTPLYVAAAAGLVGGFIATCFMTVLDVVGDTILYCFASGQRRRRQFDANEYREKKQPETGMYGWIFGEESETETSTEDEIAYAPARLKSLIVDSP